MLRAVRAVPVLCEHLPRLRSGLGLDFVVVNGENAARGFGITEKILQTVLRSQEPTAIHHRPTTPSWSQREIFSYIDGDSCLAAALTNYPQGTPGLRLRGVYAWATERKVLLLHIMTRLFMVCAG
jgi:calcineurin-like phosphoesterase